MISRVIRALWMGLGWLELTLLSVPLYLPALLGRHRRGAGYHRLFRLWCWSWVHALGVDLRLVGHHQQPLPQHFLLIANHPSAFEDIGIPALFDVDCLAKHEVRHWPIVGAISELAGTLFVDREDRESRHDAYDAIVERLREGRNVALYPEGGVKGRRLHDSFHYGAFNASLETGLPIVPVFVHYEDLDAFFWGPVSLPRKLVEIMGATNNRANYHVFDAMDPAEYDDAAAFATAAHARFLAWEERLLD